MDSQLLILLSNGFDRQKVIEFLDSNNLISYWIINLPSSIFATSSLTPRELREKIIGEFGKKHIFIIDLYNHDFSGIVPDEHFHFFNRAIKGETSPSARKDEINRKEGK